MQRVFVLVLAALFSVGFGIDSHLLQDLNGTRFWVHPDKMDNYFGGKEGQLVNFIDVTDTPELERLGIIDNWLQQPYPEKLTQQSTVRPLIVRIDAQSQARLEAVDRHLSSYNTRHARTEEGVKAVQWMKGEYEKIIAGLSPERRTLFSVELFPHSGWQQPSLIVKMKGSSDEMVILGSHIDSTSSGGVAPGADDDASGSASVLETFLIIASSTFVPSRNIEWHHYAAEELGLLGSRQVAQAYRQRSVKVHAMCQLDMTGYGNAKIAIVTNTGTNRDLNGFLKKVITEYCKNGSVDRTLFGGTSDHASWNSASYRACFPFEQQMNPNIHTVRDTMDKLNMTNAVDFIRMAVGYVVELSHQ